MTDSHADAWLGLDLVWLFAAADGGGDDVDILV